MFKLFIHSLMWSWITHFFSHGKSLCLPGYHPVSFPSCLFSTSELFLTQFMTHLCQSVSSPLSSPAFFHIISLTFHPLGLSTVWVNTYGFSLNHIEIVQFCRLVVLDTVLVAVKITWSLPRPNASISPNSPGHSTNNHIRNCLRDV